MFVEVPKEDGFMKRVWALLLCLALAIAPVQASAGADEFCILTSFYPMYLLTINVAGGIDGVRVDNMAQQNVGCLHDYTLRTGDMRMIHAADVVVINGAGMEGFVDTIISDQRKPVVDASEGIDLIIDGEAHADHDVADADHADESADAHAAHTHSDVNAHIWMSPRQAIKQVENIARGLSAQDPDHADAYQRNAQDYIARLEQLDAQVTELLSDVQGAKIVTSHPAFEYLARDYGLDIVASLGQEPGQMPRTRDMARLVDTVRDMDIKALFVEKAYSEKAAEVLSRETGVSIYALDSLTSGELTPDAYEQGILSDAMTLREALVDGNT